MHRKSLHVSAHTEQSAPTLSVAQQHGQTQQWPNSKYWTRSKTKFSGSSLAPSDLHQSRLWRQLLLSNPRVRWEVPKSWSRQRNSKACQIIPWKKGWMDWQRTITSAAVSSMKVRDLIGNTEETCHKPHSHCRSASAVERRTQESPNQHHGPSHHLWRPPGQHHQVLSDTDWQGLQSGVQKKHGSMHVLMDLQQMLWKMEE